MFSSFLEGGAVHLDNVCRLCREEYTRQFFPGFWARAGETLYAQRELSMTGFTVVLDMAWSVALAGRKKRL